MDRSPRECISTGHGLGSRHPGQVDPGAGIVGSERSEADVALKMGTCLDADYAVLFSKLPGSLHMLRDDGLYHRADDEAFGAPNHCDLFVEIHTNATTSSVKRDGREIGTEVLYEDPADKPYAAKLSKAVAAAAGLPDRGARRRLDMAVLNPHPGMTQVILEMFFGSDADDVAAYRAHFTDIELAILNTSLDRWGMRRIYSGIPPRKWGAIRRAWYRRNRFRL